MDFEYSTDQQAILDAVGSLLEQHAGPARAIALQDKDGYDTELDTALREASEELGIAADDVRVIGRLDDVYTLGVEYLITPVVGVLDQRATLSPNPDEVADVFTVGVEELGDPAHRGSVKKSWGGTQYDMPVITAGRHNIWGATYSITLNFLDCVRSARGD